MEVIGVNPVFYPISCLLWVIIGSAEAQPKSNFQSCDYADLPPSRSSPMPGQFNIFIALNKCKNEVQINEAKIPYDILSPALDSLIGEESTIHAVDIYAGEYGPCEENIDPSIIRSGIITIEKKLANITAVKTLRLVNVPTRNSHLISAVRKNVNLVMLRNCNPTIIRNSLMAVNGCKKLGTLLVYGPTEFKDLWRALYGKKELVQIHLEQDSGKMSPYGMKELIKTLPKLTSTILRCDNNCKTNFTEFAYLIQQRLPSMTIISFVSNNQKMDEAGILASRFVGRPLISLSVRGSDLIECENMAEIASNLLLIPKTKTDLFRTMYLKAEHDCGSWEELWFKTQEKVGDRGTVEPCEYPLEECRRIQGTSINVQKFTW